MSSNWPKAGPNFVPAYQVSGIPYITSSVANEVKPSYTGGTSPEAIHVSFPYVTRDITIRNTGTQALRVGFTKRGVYAPGDHLPATMNGGEKVIVDSANENDGRNYFIIPSSGSVAGTEDGMSQNAGGLQNVFQFNIRCTDLYFLSDDTQASSDAVANRTSFTVYAGLTGISRYDFPTITGSNGFEGVG